MAEQAETGNVGGRVRAVWPALRAAAPSLSVVIQPTASSDRVGAIAPRLSAVVKMPVPNGLVSTSTSPGRASALVTMRRGSTTPVIAIPYFGSSSLIVWPPRIGDAGLPRDGRAALEDCATRIARSRSSGKATMLRARNRAAAHRVNVGERVGRRNAAEVERVVDDRREEIEGLHQRQIVGDEIDARRRRTLP